MFVRPSNMNKIIDIQIVYYMLQLSLITIRSFKSQIKYIIQITNKTFNLNFVMQSTSLIISFIMNTWYKHLKDLLKVVDVETLFRTFKIEVNKSFSFCYHKLHI